MSVENNYVFTSESVSEGHPDKVCDRISDAILDAFLAREPEARVAVETLTTTNLIVLAGEVRPAGLVSNEEIEEIARTAVRDGLKCRGRPQLFRSSSLARGDATLASKDLLSFFLNGSNTLAPARDRIHGHDAQRLRGSLD